MKINLLRLLFFLCLSIYAKANVSISVTPNPGKVGDVFTFRFESSGDLDKYQPKIRLYDGNNIAREDIMIRMNSHLYVKEYTITKAGKNRKYKIGYKVNGSYHWDGKYFYYTVDKVNNNVAPKISKYNTPNSATVGDTVTLLIKATDDNNNLGTVQVNWGDEGAKAYLCSKYSGDIFECSHSYQNTGTFTWSVTAYDNGTPRLSSNTLSAQIKVNSEVYKPNISTLNKTSFKATDNVQDLRIYGSNFTNDTIVYINYGSGWKSQSSRYTHIINSREIKFDLRTTRSGSGTWKVKVKNSNGYSNYKTFDVKKLLSKPSTPSLKSPSNYATLNGTSQTLSWYSVSGAEKYEIYLRDETTNNWIFSDRGEKQVTGTSVSYNNFKEGHTYVWNLRALNSVGYSGLSETRRFTIKKSPVKINGSCGTADNHKYPANTKSFGSYTQCSAGTPDSTTFSVQSDNTVSWHCLGKNGGTDVLCMASVEKFPTTINGECGTANNHTFLATDTGYGSYTQCKQGVANTTQFPSKGSTQNWICKGQNGGANANCSASRQSDGKDTQNPTVTILEEENNIQHTGNLLKILLKVLKILLMI